ncbi:hypothetical protein BC936DRAFT_142057 [Jimgerdemannia flammicorona]|uniref:Uncharacterized protein n=1 Tax=Jimgerdemannia flammicorona TaxID=994334 RepID=A0A433DFJ5_9FUNG|nr:hypothetical protein BC936DRAFT_142057 [Jimgerdemannia flammicorona]
MQGVVAGSQHHPRFSFLLKYSLWRKCPIGLYSARVRILLGIFGRVPGCLRWPGVLVGAKARFCSLAWFRLFGPYRTNTKKQPRLPFRSNEIHSSDVTHLLRKSSFSRARVQRHSDVTVPTAEQVLVPETLLKKRKNQEKTAAARAAADAEKRKVCIRVNEIGYGDWKQRPTVG